MNVISRKNFAVRGESLLSGRPDEGFTLFELLIAMLMIVMVSAMLYSILNVGISFAKKGEDRIERGERQRAFLDLLHRQIHGAWFDQKENKLKILVKGDSLRLVTTSPLLNRDVTMVVAFYEYDKRDDTLYYSEKLDFYNPEYFDDYTPAPEEMFALLEGVEDPGFDYDEKEGLVKVDYVGKTYEFVPRCWVANSEEE